ncbi:hypothetical protein CDAR_269061 [Caerostris darwini]|uniref:Uncharacterized protein n=1 Tax=Caerostris darwini TaxID=1538125 RepID=A0AAV4RAR6_9ARAC|nr:hypothetical protein CDAR_269061 [Caerostris darwini]
MTFFPILYFRTEWRQTQRKSFKGNSEVFVSLHLWPKAKSGERRYERNERRNNRELQRNLEKELFEAFLNVPACIRRNTFVSDSVSENFELELFFEIKVEYFDLN